ncbi:BQ5605_C005g03620 [Microbotryum silenes-dioicae]|uniref:BQ5605_C005g03620 protein n=1 Tax=Microbotryum silenes-dioicae TaxID=796604 RepID=A0A2X0MFT8_9BASI|nr:BQ5605_C005g03620 [Microbotryum silenes-dioicae]
MFVGSQRARSKVLTVSYSVWEGSLHSNAEHIAHCISLGSLHPGQQLASRTTPTSMIGPNIACCSTSPEFELLVFRLLTLLPPTSNAPAR